MSDIDELLEVRSHKSYPDNVTEVYGYIDDLIDAISNLESERKHHEMTAGCLCTDLEYMTRRAEAAERRLAELQEHLDEIAQAAMGRPS